MINKFEFEVLSTLLSSQKVDEKKYSKSIASLLRDKCITKKYGIYDITSDGKRCWEEFYYFELHNKREELNIQISNEANQLAKDANNIAEESKLKSQIANKISIFAIVVSTLSIVSDVIIAIIFAK